MRHEKDVFLDFGIEKVPDLPPHLLRKNSFKMPINNLILLIAKHRRTGGIKINHRARIGGLNAHQQRRQTAIRPILQHNLLVQLELLLDLAVEFVVHLLVVLD